jgi:hypothetical protein
MGLERVAAALIADGEAAASRGAAEGAAGTEGEGAR